MLGLGIKGDIGTAVAMEIRGTVYAPLHDFGGNVIALLSSDGQMAESYEIDAFGKEKISSPPINPWRFSSKRNEEGLVFFGLRFYDPSLGRWLTPDPTGFTDGSNLYAYVRNSPLNRLDLFGLASEDPFPDLKPIEFNIPIAAIPIDNRLFRCRILEGGSYTDYLVSCGYWHQLQFTPHEKQSRQFNLFNHSELMPSGGRIGLVTYRHGVDTLWGGFFATCKSMTEQLPGTLFIGRYHGTNGIGMDGMATSLELNNIETIEVCKTRQFLIACSQGLHKANPAVFGSSGVLQSLGALWVHYDHSRGGVIDLRALQGMPYEQKQILQTQLLMTCVAPALPVPREFGLEVKNYYSSQDFVTGGFGAPDSLWGMLGGIAGGLTANSFFDRSNCDIQFVPCVSKWSERSFGLADHAILGGTYRGVTSRSIGRQNETYGFYDGKTR